MVQICCAVKCKNTCDREKGISLHKFPVNNPELLAQWVQAVKTDKWKLTKSSKLCSAHFEKEDFYPDQSKKTLRENAVPTIFAHQPKVRKRPPPRKRASPKKRAPPRKPDNLEVNSTATDPKIIVYILPIVISSTPSSSTEAVG